MTTATPNCPQEGRDMESTAAPFVPRTIDMKLETARDTQAWLQQVYAQEPSEDVACMLSVLTNLIQDYERVLSKLKLTETAFYTIRNAQLLAATLLEEHLNDHSAALAAWAYTDVPTNAVELIATVLNDAIDHFATSMQLCRYQRLTEDELRAIVAIL
jgi:hypothetical protein